MHLPLENKHPLGLTHNIADINFAMATRRIHWRQLYVATINCAIWRVQTMDPWCSNPTNGHQNNCGTFGMFPARHSTVHVSDWLTAVVPRSPPDTLVSLSTGDVLPPATLTGTGRPRRPGLASAIDSFMGWQVTVKRISDTWWFRVELLIRVWLLKLYSSLVNVRLKQLNVAYCIL